MILKRLSQIFIGLSVVCFFAGVGVLATHAYFDDYFFDSIQAFDHPASKFLNPGANDVTVLLASDSGSYNNILEGVIVNARKLHPEYDFMMYLGDMATTGSITGYYWMLEEILPKLTGLPMYAIPGNHDVTRRVGLSKQIVVNKAFYTTVMGAAYYWFGYGNTLFIALDTSTPDIDDEQLQWLVDTLKNIRPMFRNCVIFNHMPPINTRPDFFKDHTMSPESADKLASVLRGHKIDAMFFGHVHYFSTGKFAGIPIYTIPSSGQSVRDKTEPRWGYVTLKIGRNGIKSVEPSYIDFVGPKREMMEEWWARDILSTKGRDCVTGFFYVFISCLIIGGLFRIAYKISNKK